MLNRTAGLKSRQISDATALDSASQNISTASTDKLKTPSGVRTRAQSRREQQLTPAARVNRSPLPANKPRAKRTRSFKARSRKSCAKPPDFDTDTDADAEQEAEITPHSAERSDNLETTSGVRTRAQSRRDSLVTPTCVAPQNHKPRSTQKKTRKTRRLKTKEVADNCDLSISPSASHSPANRQCHGGQATLELEQQQQQQTSSASQPLPSSLVTSADCTSTPSTTSTGPKALQLVEFEESVPQGEVNSPLITQTLSTRLIAAVNSSSSIAHSSSDNNSSKASNADQQQEPEEQLLEVANRTSSASSERQGNHLSGQDGNSSERPIGISVALQVQPLTTPHKDADPSPARTKRKSATATKKADAKADAERMAQLRKMRDEQLQKRREALEAKLSRAKENREKFLLERVQQTRRRSQSRGASRSRSRDRFNFSELEAHPPITPQHVSSASNASSAHPSAASAAPVPTSLPPSKNDAAEREPCVTRRRTKTPVASVAPLPRHAADAIDGPHEKQHTLSPKRVQSKGTSASSTTSSTSASATTSTPIAAKPLNLRLATVVSLAHSIPVAVATTPKASALSVASRRVTFILPDSATNADTSLTAPPSPVLRPNLQASYQPPPADGTPERAQQFKVSNSQSVTGCKRSNNSTVSQPLPRRK